MIAISDVELCSLLSNSLENAIAAAALMEVEKLRRVYVRILINGDKLVISTENAYTGKIEMVGELPQSQNTATGHGFGIKSMAAIVKRRDGLYSIETSDGIFTLRLVIPLT